MSSESHGRIQQYGNPQPLQLIPQSPHPAQIQQPTQIQQPMQSDLVPQSSTIQGRSSLNNILERRNNENLLNMSILQTNQRESDYELYGFVYKIKARDLPLYKN